MPLPPELDKKIRERFEELEIEAKRILSTRRSESSTDEYISAFEALKIKTVNLLQNIKARDSQLIEYIRKSSRSDISTLHGWIVAYKDDYEKGFLGDLTQMIEANITGDYLELAEDLLTGSKRQTGSYNHVPATVLTGAILEESLRILCQRQSPPIVVKKQNGEPKTLGVLIDDLKASGLYNELKAKQLRAWADIRNAAAHGEFDKFNEQDVDAMIKGVKNFLAEYM